MCSFPIAPKFDRKAMEDNIRYVECRRRGICYESLDSKIIQQEVDQEISNVTQEVFKRLGKVAQVSDHLVFELEKEDFISQEKELFKKLVQRIEELKNIHTKQTQALEAGQKDLEKQERLITILKQDLQNFIAVLNKQKTHPTIKTFYKMGQTLCNGISQQTNSDNR